MLYVLTCLTCLRASCVRVIIFFRALRAFSFLRALRAFMFYLRAFIFLRALHTLTIYVPCVPSFLRALCTFILLCTLRPFIFLRALRVFISFACLHFYTCLQFIYVYAIKLTQINELTYGCSSLFTF